MISEGHVSFESGFMLLSMSAHSFILVFSDTVISVFCFGFFYYGKTHLIFNTSILQYFSTGRGVIVQWHYCMQFFQTFLE